MDAAVKVATVPRQTTARIHRSAATGAVARVPPGKTWPGHVCVCVGAQRSRPFRCLGSLLGGARGCAHDAARASRRVSLLHNLRRDCHICAETRRCIRRSARFWSAATPCRRMRRTMPGPATHAACAAPVRCAAPSTTRSTLAAVSIGHPLRPAPHQRTGTGTGGRSAGPTCPSTDLMYARRYRMAWYQCKRRLTARDSRWLPRRCAVRVCGCTPAPHALRRNDTDDPPWIQRSSGAGPPNCSLLHP